MSSISHPSMRPVRDTSTASFLTTCRSNTATASTTRHTAALHRMEDEVAWGSGGVGNPWVTRPGAACRDHEEIRALEGKAVALGEETLIDHLYGGAVEACLCLAIDRR